MTKFVSKYVQDKLTSWLFGSAMGSAPTAYVALVTTAPTDTTGTSLVELSSSGYARVLLGSGSATSTSGTGTTSVEQQSNSSAITFGPATTNWTTVVGVALYDASSSGNLLAYGDLNNQIAVLNGNTFQIAAANLALQA